MKPDIIFATKNKGKIIEVQAILGHEDFHVVSMEDAGIHIDVVEDGETFEANALKKAIEIMKVSGQIVLADDSGLEIDFLDKRPGVYSARYLGENTPYIEKNAQILAMLDGVPDEKRTARFVSVIAAAFPDGRTYTTLGTIEGMIGHTISGENGFGYDPIFYVPAYAMTMAEMSLAAKNEVSHRGKALRSMKQNLILAAEQ